MHHYSQSGQSQRMQVLEEGAESSGCLTAADTVMLSGWQIAASKVLDHLMLISRLIISNSCAGRDNRWTSLLSFTNDPAEFVRH